MPTVTPLSCGVVPPRAAHALEGGRARGWLSKPITRHAADRVKLAASAPRAPKAGPAGHDT